MIASYKYNFIFIKTRKTAGTSIELALGEHCGPDDIITPIGKLGVERAARGVVPRNFSRTPELEAAYADALRARDYRRMVALRTQIQDSGRSLTSHVVAKKVRGWVGEEFWNGAYKFTAERHPYAKAASLARHAYRRDIPFPVHLNRIVFRT